MTGTLTELILAMLAFLAIHIIPSSFLRERMIGRIGMGGYMAFFNILSIVVFVWLIFAYSATSTGERYWDPGNAGRYIGIILMLISSIFLVSSYTSPNPTVIGGARLLEKESAYRGINAITRHPLMWAITLWSIVHLINNGDSSGLVFFGGLGLLALCGTFLIDAKKGRQLGEGWNVYKARTSNIPFLALIEGRAKLSLKPLWWRILLGLVLFFVLFHFHAFIFGGSPAPY